MSGALASKVRFTLNYLGIIAGTAASHSGRDGNS
jgi:hypothetical protein